MNDLAFITGLMRDDYDAVGFIPAPKIASYYIANGQYAIQRDRRGRRVGYILHGKPTPNGILSITQAIVEVDRRGQGFGDSAVKTVLDRAVAGGCRAVKLRCGEDLSANEFWRREGFLVTKINRPENKRKRAINTYMMELRPGLFDWSQFRVVTEERF